MELYEQCAKEGIAEATAALGQYYEKGEGDVAADPKKALPGNAVRNAGPCAQLAGKGIGAGL